MPDAGDSGKAQRLITGVLLVGFLMPLMTSSSGAPPVTRAWSQLLLLGGGAAWFLLLARAGRASSGLRIPLVLGSLLFLTVAAATGPFVFESWERLITWFSFAVGAAALADLQRRVDVRRASLVALLAVLGLLALFGVAQTVWLYESHRAAARELLPLPETAQPFLESWRARATFGQANGFGGWLALLLPLTFAVVALDRRFGVVMLLLTLVAFGASFSRGAMICATFGAAVWLRATASRDLRRIGTLLALAAPFGFVLAGYVGGMIGTSTLVLRFHYWSSTVDVAATQGPWGVGLGLYGAHAEPVRGAFSTYAHNGYLALWAEAGWVGLAFVGFAVWWLAARKRRVDAAIELDAGTQRAVVTPLVCVACAAVLAHWVTPWNERTLDFDLPLPSLWNVAILLTFGGFAQPVADGLARRPDLVRRSVRAGLLALMLHVLIDMDLYVDGVVATACLLGSLSAGCRPQSAARRGAPGLELVVAAVAIAALGFWQVRVAGTSEATPQPIAIGLVAGDRDEHAARVARSALDDSRRPPPRLLGLTTHVSHALRTETVEGVRYAIRELEEGVRRFGRLPVLARRLDLLHRVLEVEPHAFGPLRPQARDLLRRGW